MSVNDFIKDWLSKADEDFEVATYLLKENEVFLIIKRFFMN